MQTWFDAQLDQKILAVSTGKRAFMQIGQLVKAPDERKVSFFQIFLPFTIFVYRKTQLEF